MGPKILSAAKVRIEPTLSIQAAAELIDAIEHDLKVAMPEIGWCFIEIDP
jgi:divalent metal cation (Fe/Co/Zn/Cd) transporter